MNNHEIETRPSRGNPRETGRISQSQLNFFKLVSQLSEIKRQGWIDRGIKNPESVAEHSYQVAVMTMFEAERKGLDVGRATAMALIHDLPEIYSGDITPHQHLPESQREEVIFGKWIAPPSEVLEEKRKKEEEGLQRIAQRLPTQLRASIVELWRELNEEQTKESRLVHRMDSMQRLLQAKRYRDQEGDSFPIDSMLQETIESNDPELQRLARSIQKNMS